MMKGGGIRYGRSYGAESVENVEFARSKRSLSKMNGTKSSLPYALGVSLERMHSRLHDHVALRREAALRRLADHVHPRYFELHRVQFVVGLVEDDGSSPSTAPGLT